MEINYISRKDVQKEKDLNRISGSEGQIPVSYTHLQVNAFRKFHGIPCATTMCIGNMRSATEMLCKYQVTGNQELKKKSMHYYFVILVFAVGAAMGALFIRQIGDRTIWIAAILLLAGFVLMFIKEDREDVRR